MFHDIFFYFPVQFHRLLNNYGKKVEEEEEIL